jgi:hypothetical protein
MPWRICAALPEALLLRYLACVSMRRLFRIEGRIKAQAVLFLQISSTRNEYLFVCARF